MFSHHILSIFLITGSYHMNYTRIGTVVHVFMDFCDILLPVSPTSALYARGRWETSDRYLY